MTTTATALLVLTGLLAVGDWVSVARDDRRRELVLKPATLLALLAVAATLEAADGDMRRWFLVALGCSLAGDVFLLWSERFFVAGLASFLLGHLAYIGGLLTAGTEPAGAAGGAVLVLVALLVVGRPILAGVRATEPELLVPVVAYIAVISTMVVASFGHGAVWGVLGASSFYASDALIAWTRFVRDHRWGRPAVMVTYHLGQVLLVLTLL